MNDINEFRGKVKSLLSRHVNPSPVTEKTDFNVSEISGALLAAGPQKVGEVIQSMDPNTFAALVQHIDAEGMKPILASINGQAAPAPTANDAPAPGTPEAPAADPAMSQAASTATPPKPSEDDLGDLESMFGGQ